MKKRISALLLCLLLCLGMVGTAFAAGDHNEDNITASAKAGEAKVTVSVSEGVETGDRIGAVWIFKDPENSGHEELDLYSLFNFSSSDGSVGEITVPAPRTLVAEEWVRIVFTDDCYKDIQVEEDVEETEFTVSLTSSNAYIGRKVTLTAKTIPPTVVPKDVAWEVVKDDYNILDGPFEPVDELKTTVQISKDAKLRQTAIVKVTVDGVESNECTIKVVSNMGAIIGSGTGASSVSGYAITVNKTTNGTVSVSPSRAVEGETVTITVRPNEGYELDTLTVKDADGKTIRTTSIGDNKYTFTMPDSKVEIDATFKAIAEVDTTPSFSDVPSSYWAYEQIIWAAKQGIMNGYANGTFGPDNNTTRQALWMVLGRLSGELNADSTMAQAREWAIANNVSDGTNPGNAMSRQQMVTMLYRYAQMKGYATNGSTDLSTYPDAAGVASYAQDALSWAVANGVVTGTTDGRLNPEGTASRAHFAVFMYRFCGLYADEA